MKNLIGLVCGATAALLAVASNGLATTVKLKDGRIIEGEIQGRVVQRALKPEVQNAASYEITNGKDVVAIDEQGLHVVPGCELLAGTTTQQRKPLDDFEVIQILVEPPASPYLFPKTKGGAKVLRFGPARRREEDVISTTPLLGTFRGDPGKRSLLPALEIVTPAGSVTVQVAEIVPFTPTSK